MGHGFSAIFWGDSKHNCVEVTSQEDPLCKVLDKASFGRGSKRNWSSGNQVYQWLSAFMLIRLFPSFFHGISLARFWNILQVSLEKIRWTTLWNAFEFGQNDFFLTAFDCFSGEYEHFQHMAMSKTRKDYYFNRGKFQGLTSSGTVQQPSHLLWPRVDVIIDPSSWITRHPCTSRCRNCWHYVPRQFGGSFGRDLVGGMKMTSNLLCELGDDRRWTLNISNDLMFGFWSSTVLPFNNIWFYLYRYSEVATMSRTSKKVDSETCSVPWYEVILR